jgi:NADH dehydrogenase
MRVAVVGGTGFVGNYLVEALLDKGFRPALLVRPGSEHKVRRSEECDIIRGDINAVGDIVSVLKYSDAAVFNIGILREDARRGVTFDALQFKGAARFIEAANAAGTSRLLLMSANGVKENGTLYQDTKFRAEQYALASGIDVTIFRPSVIFGDPRGAMEFATQLNRDMVSTLLPAVGFFNAMGPHRGHLRMSPVHVKDVADAFVHALQDPSTVGEKIVLAGPEDLTWREMLLRVAAAVGRDKWVMPMPIEVMKLAAFFLDWLPAFPVTRDQLTMLAESNTGDGDNIRRLLGREPMAFAGENLAYLANGQT